MATAVWVEGDTAGPLRFTLRTNAGAQNLSAATVVCERKHVPSGVVVEVPCVVTMPSQGRGEITQAERATWPAGSYALRFRVTYLSGAVDVFPSDGVEPVAVVRPAWEVTV